MQIACAVQLKCLLDTKGFPPPLKYVPLEVILVIANSTLPVVEHALTAVTEGPSCLISQYSLKLSYSRRHCIDHPHHKCHKQISWFSALAVTYAHVFVCLCLCVCVCVCVCVC